MIKHNKTNDMQLELLFKIKSGLVDIPKTSAELFELVQDALLLRDFDQDEKQSLIRSKIQFIKVLKQIGGDKEFVYVSSLKSKATKANYFKELKVSQARRGIDTFRLIRHEMAEKQITMRNGLSIMLKNGYEDYLTELEAQYELTTATGI